MATESLEKYRDIMERCIRCSLCKWVPQIQIKSQKYSAICPSIEEYNFHNYSGGGRLITALALLCEKIPYNDKLMEVVYACTECGGCDVSCKNLNDLEPLEVIQELRELLVKKGYGPLPNQQKYVENSLEMHNPYGEDHKERTSWLPKDTKLTPGAELGYFTGCTSSYRRKELAEATARVFNKIGVEFNLLDPDEFCCGSPIYRVGEVDKAKQLMEENVKKIEKAGIKKLVTSCAGCYAMFKAEYPKVIGKELPFEVLHTSELLEILLNEGKMKFTKKVPMTVTYHDPCHLGRGSEPYPKWDGKMVEVMPLIKMPLPPKPKRQGTFGCYEPPRNVLMQIPGIQLIEMERNREYAYCCGAGGGVKAQFPEFAINTSKRRIEEAIATNAETLVSCCPFCKTNLQEGIVAKKSDLKFFDLIELVEKAL
ncbi:MAG: (Fe-S)-binding protein [Candidatus Lokiarchaeota archaeon]|nr:(Fe-S)-binding protein [Candidatus Lokiarchaeota archaeon]